MSVPLTHVERAFEDEKFGAWVLKSPGTFRDFPNTPGRRFMPLANPNAREARLMRAGDRIVFWTTKNYVFPSTIWAIGTLTTGVRAPRASKQLKPEYVGTRGIYVDWEPVPIEFREHTAIGNLKLFTRFKDAAPLKRGSVGFLTTDEFSLVEEVLSKAQELHQSRPTDDLPVPLVEVHGYFDTMVDTPILRGTARKRNNTEKLAIAAAMHHFEQKLGYSVEDVGANKDGWDLTVSDQKTNKPVFYVEVKGVSIQPKSKSSLPQRATLSPDEVNFALKDPKWQLVIVNVDEPRTRVYGAHAYKQSDFEPVARRLIPHGTDHLEPSVKIPGIRARGYEFNFEKLGLVGTPLDLTGFEYLRTSLYNKRKKRKKK